MFSVNFAEWEKFAAPKSNGGVPMIADGPPMLSKAIYRYSPRSDQLLLNFQATPAPPAKPTLVWLNDAAQAHVGAKVRSV